MPIQLASASSQEATIGGKSIWAVRPFSVFLLVRPTSVTSFKGFFNHKTDGQNSKGWFFETNGAKLFFEWHTGVASPTAQSVGSPLIINHWMLVGAVLRQNGAASNVDLMVYDYVTRVFTLDTITGLADADPAVDATPHTSIGEADTDYYDGEISWAGLWSADMMNAGSKNSTLLRSLIKYGPWRQRTVNLKSLHVFSAAYGLRNQASGGNALPATLSSTAIKFTPAVYTEMGKGDQSLYWLNVPSTGLPEITVQGAISDPNDTVAGTATVADTASGSISDPNDTVASTATVAASVSGSISDPNDTVAGTSTVSSTAVGSITDPNDTTTGTVGLSIVGVGSIADPNDTVVGTVGSANTAVGSITDPNDTVTGSTAETITAQGSIADPNDTVIGTVSQTNVPPITVQGNISDPNETVTGSVSETVTAVGGISDPNDTVFGRAGVPPAASTPVRGEVSIYEPYPVEISTYEPYPVEISVYVVGSS